MRLRPSASAARPAILRRRRHPQRALDRAATVLAGADGVLIGAGAGMSAESGMGTYRGPGGVWGSKQVDADGLTVRQRASAESLRTHPYSTLDHYARRWQAAQAAVPHEGYRLLTQLSRSKPAGAFVYTSNVDNLFAAAGIAEDHLYEGHGSLARSQCLAGCGAQAWTTPADGASVCPGCGGRGRPNVLLFDDYDFDGTHRDEQWRRWGAWLADRRGSRLVVLEVGAGTAIPTVRHRSEALAARGWPLIRVNLAEPAIPHSDGVELGMGAGAALRTLLG